MKTIPLATVPDLAQVEGLRPRLNSRHCVVLGSAPLSAPATVDADEILIVVNGAISSALRTPDLWFLGSKAQDKPGNIFMRPLHRTMLEQARGREAGHIVLLRGPKVASERDTLAALDKLKCRYASWSVFDKPTKLFLERETCARLDKDPCSSGILAAACALWCGATSVRLVGFSFTPGYHYLQKERPMRWWRGHVDADARALRALRGRYGERLSGDLVQAVAA